MARILSSHFVRSVIAVASGTAAAQAIAMLASPVITRLYGPEAFGQLGVFNSTINLIAPAAALAYPMAIVLPSMNSDARQIAKLSLLIAAATSALIGLLLLFFSAPIVAALHLEEISQYLFLIPLAILFSSGQQVAQQWLIRHKLFGASGRVSVVQALLVNSANVIGGFLRPLGTVLIWVATTGRLLHVGLLSLAGRGQQRTGSRGDASTAMGVRQVAHRYRDFPLFRAPQELVTAASQSLPIILLASFFDPAVAGLYTLCRSVLALPSQLLGTSVGSVFYPRITEAASSGERLTGLIVRATVALAGVSFLPYLSVMLFGPQLFSFVFGSEWEMAGEFARWVSLISFSSLINRPAAQALPVLSAQGHNLVLSIATIAFRIAGLLIGFRVFGSPLVAIALYSIVGLLANAVLYFMIIRFSRRFDAGASPNRFS